jgi:hypothetical protein
MCTATERALCALCISVCALNGFLDFIPEPLEPEPEQVLCCVDALLKWLVAAHSGSVMFPFRCLCALSRGLGCPRRSGERALPLTAFDQSSLLSQASCDEVQDRAGARAAAAQRRVALGTLRQLGARGAQARLSAEEAGAADR